MGRTIALDKRFWPKVDKSGDCWIWTACKGRDGYGLISVDGVLRVAHRVSFEMEHGPIAPGAQIDHVCFNKSCVRPAHLRAVTPSQNQWHQVRPQKNSKSGYLGVSWSARHGKWRALIGLHGKVIYIGLFDDPAVAHEAYLAKKAELHQIPSM